MDQDVRNTILQNLDKEQLEVSGIVFQENEVILEIFRSIDIQASSYIELPPKYKKNQSIINMKNKDQFCFLWSISAFLYPVVVNKKTSNYSMYFNEFNLESLE